MPNIDFNIIFKSKAFKIVFFSVAALIVILLIFRAGMMVGFNRADHSFRWGENYHQNFGGPRRGIFNTMKGDDFVNGHGVSGQIIKIDGSSITVKERGNSENVVLLTDKTVIRRFQEVIKVNDLKIDDRVVVIGGPNNSGQVEAQFIRVLPSPPSNSATSTSSMLPPPLR